MSDHEDLVADDEILGNSPGKFGLTVRHHIVISESVDTPAQNVQTGVDRSGLSNVMTSLL